MTQWPIFTVYTFKNKGTQNDRDNFLFKKFNSTPSSSSGTALGPLENVKSDWKVEASSDEWWEVISPTYTSSYKLPVLSDEDSELE